MSLDRPKTNPETPIPREFAREQRITAAETAIDWIKESLERQEKLLEKIDVKPHVCIQERAIERSASFRKIVSGVLVALGMTVLGSFATIAAQCESQGRAQGALTTRVDNHSERIMGVEKSVRELDSAREADTLRILEAIREASR